MELAFSSRSITQSDLIPFECLIPRRRPLRGQPGCRIERLERRLHCDASVQFAIDSANPVVLVNGVSGVWMGNDGIFTLNPGATIDEPATPPNGGGILDGSFSEDGVARVDGFDMDSAQAVVIQSDGKIVVAGWSADRAKASTGGDFQVSGITVLRLNTDGSLDTSFGTNGFTHIPIESDGFNRSIAETMPMVQMADGSLLVGGHMLHKLSADGQLDTSFGDNGVALAGDNPDFWLPDYPRVSSIAVTADGKILATDDRFHITRLNADGTVDQSFGNGGVVSAADDGRQHDFKDQAHLAVQADGKILAFGTANMTLGEPVRESLLTRLNADGSRDTSFGDGGFVRRHGANDTDYLEGWNLVVRPDGKILTCGQSHDGMVLTQYLPDGTLDSSFGDGGVALDNAVNGPFQVALDAEGKILIAAQGGGVLAARYNANGTRDTTFGDNGYAATHVANTNLAPGRGIGENAQSLAIQNDGKIVVVGHVQFYSEAEFDHADFLVVRLDPSGNSPAPSTPTDTGGETPEAPPAETSGTPPPGGGDGMQAPELSAIRLRLALLPIFSSDSIASRFDFDDRSGKKDDFAAEPQETVLPT